MLTRRALAISRMRGWVPSTWRGWALVALIVAWLAGFIASQLTNGSALSGWLLIGSTVGCLAVDARAFVTLGGRLHWRRMPMWARIGLAVLYVGCLMPAVYAVTSARDGRRAYRQGITARAQRIAQLERELGL